MVCTCWFIVISYAVNLVIVCCCFILNFLSNSVFSAEKNRLLGDRFRTSLKQSELFKITDCRQSELRCYKTDRSLFCHRLLRTIKVFLRKTR